MKKTVKLLFGLILLCLISASVLASGKSGFAKIVDIEGKVSIKRRGGDRMFKAAKGMKLVEGDTLITDKTGNVTVVLENNNQIVIGKDTEVNLSQMKELDKQSLSVKVELKTGTIFNHVKNKLKKNETFEIKAVNLVAGVRGTKFYVSTDGNKTNVKVDEGKVKLQTVLSEKSLIVERGELASAVMQQKPYLVLSQEDITDIEQDIDDDFFDDNDEEEYDYDDVKDDDKEFEDSQNEDSQNDDSQNDDHQEEDSQQESNRDTDDNDQDNEAEE